MYILFLCDLFFLPYYFFYKLNIYFIIFTPLISDCLYFFITVYIFSCLSQAYIHLSKTNPFTSLFHLNLSLLYVYL